MAVYAPVCKKDLVVHETFITSVTKISREGRRAWAKDFLFIGDLNVELGPLCTDEDDNHELNEMCGLLCWQGCERDHGGFKELMWYGIKKESKMARLLLRGPVTVAIKNWPHTDILGIDGGAGLHRWAKKDVG